MKKNANLESQARRRFLRTAAISSGAAVTLASAPAALQAQESTEATPEQAKGYRLTQHVIDYYKSAAE